MKAVEVGVILGELQDLLKDVEVGALGALEEKILLARRVYVAGAGRSGLMVRGFAMRLMHMGIQSFVVGEIVTPSFQAGDLLLVGSGSGETASLCAIATKAKAIGGALALVTIVPTSTLGRMADVVVRLDAPSPKAKLATGAAPRTSAQAMGSLFEQGLLLTLDAVVMRLQRARGAAADEMFGRHANLE